MSNNPTNLAAVSAKRMDDGATSLILQPINQINFVANPVDLATALTAVIAIRDGLVAKGLMKPS